MRAPESLRVEQGRRTGQTIMVCVDSTVLGPALGGRRIKSYPSWHDGVEDAVRLSAAMTEKAALADLDHGGGKTVVDLDPLSTGRPDGSPRRELLHHIGDVVESFGGRYWTGPDVGSSPEDVAVIGERTQRVFCRPERVSGSGDSSAPTAAGVLASIQAVRQHVLAGQSLTDTSFAIVGLGHVGQLLAEHLAAAGSQLTSPISIRADANWPNGGTLTGLNQMRRCSPRSMSSCRPQSVVSSPPPPPPPPSRSCAAGPSWARPTTSSTPTAPQSCSTRAASSGHRTPSSAPAASWQRPPANYSTSPTQRPTDYSPASETVSRTYSTKPASTTDPHCTLRANTLSDVYSTSTETDTAASLTRADSAAES